MSSINKAIIIGRLGKDPELRFTQTGVPVCRFSVATSESYTNNNGEKIENTEWHRIVIWNKLAEHANTYLKKGSQVYLEGKLKTTTYEKEGQKHWATDIHCNVMKFIGGKPSNSEENQNQGQNNNNSNQNKSAKKSNQQKSQSQQQNPPNEPDFEDFGGNPGDDDIPF